MFLWLVKFSLRSEIVIQWQAGTGYLYGDGEKSFNLVKTQLSDLSLTTYMRDYHILLLRLDKIILEKLIRRLLMGSETFIF